jgi:hypothetical protein
MVQLSNEDLTRTALSCGWKVEEVMNKGQSEYDLLSSDDDNEGIKKKKRKKKEKEKKRRRQDEGEEEGEVPSRSQPPPAQSLWRTEGSHSLLNKEDLIERIVSSVCRQWLS